MTEIEVLHRAVADFRRNIASFPVGAICPRDLKSIDERIADTREYLLRLNAQLLAVKAERDAQALTTVPTEGESEETFYHLEEATTNALLASKTVELCLHSYAFETELSANKDVSEIHKKMRSYARKLFALNDSVTKLQAPMEELYEKQLDLKIHCQKLLIDYQKFMAEQKRMQGEKLQEISPEIASTKDKMYNTLRKINVMKKLITSFIAASGHMLIEKPSLADMLEKHRELINIESIQKMTSNTTAEP